MIYKYCAPKDDNASFKVNLKFNGKTTGSQGQDFLDWLMSMPKPKLTDARDYTDPNSGNKRKVWNCARADVADRCYEDNGSIVFLAVGGDENTFDYNQSSYSEGEQLELWLGDNLVTHAKLLGIGNGQHRLLMRMGRLRLQLRMDPSNTLHWKLIATMLYQIRWQITHVGTILLDQYLS